MGVKMSALAQVSEYSFWEIFYLIFRFGEFQHSWTI